MRPIICQQIENLTANVKMVSAVFVARMLHNVKVGVRIELGEQENEK